MTMRLCAAVVDDFGAHLYEVGLGKGDAVGGAHGAAEQLGGGWRQEYKIGLPGKLILC